MTLLGLQPSLGSKPLKLQCRFGGRTTQTLSTCLHIWGCGTKRVHAYVVFSYIYYIPGICYTYSDQKQWHFFLSSQHDRRAARLPRKNVASPEIKKRPKHCSKSTLTRNIGAVSNINIQSNCSLYFGSEWYNEDGLLPALPSSRYIIEKKNRLTKTGSAVKIQNCCRIST